MWSSSRSEKETASVSLGSSRASSQVLTIRSHIRLTLSGMAQHFCRCIQSATISSIMHCWGLRDNFHRLHLDQAALPPERFPASPSSDCSIVARNPAEIDLSCLPVSPPGAVPVSARAAIRNVLLRTSSICAAYHAPVRHLASDGYRFDILCRSAAARRAEEMGHSDGQLYDQ